MKKRMSVCFFILTTCLFYFSIPNVVFGQSLAKQVFDEYEELLLQNDIRALLPDALVSLKNPQSPLNYNIIGFIVKSPNLLKSYVPDVDSQFIDLLKVNDNLKLFLTDDPVRDLILDPAEIDELLNLINQVPTTPTSLKKVASTDNQYGSLNAALQLFIVVTDLNDNPLTNIPVTFRVPVGYDGELSPTTARTDKSGQAQTTLTLRPNPGIYKVEATVVDYPSLTQTFTAAATTAIEDPNTAIAPKKVTISEIMFVSKMQRLPQWIELNNSSGTEVNLEGWTLEIHGITIRSDEFTEVGLSNEPLKNNITINPPHIYQHIRFTFPQKSINPQKTLLIASTSSKSFPKSSLGQEQVYVPDIDVSFLSNLLQEQAFYLKLSNKKGQLVDEVGNLNILTHKPDWFLPKSVTEDDTPPRRASMIRRHDNRLRRLGTREDAWISAIKTQLANDDNSIAYYGDPTDIGAPGIKSGGPVPVQLSSFRAERTDAGVAITWSTESELNNAGFTIHRSKTQNGVFQSIHARLILGAGTTGEKNDYTFMDTTAEPEVIYYYQIEDISFGGVRQTLATTRLRGDFSAKSKFTTTWGSLKGQY